MASDFASDLAFTGVISRVPCANAVATGAQPSACAPTILGSGPSINPASYNSGKAGQLLFPGCRVPVAANGSCSVADTFAVNPVTGARYPGAQIGLFDPASFSGTPYSGIDLYPDGKYFDTEHTQLGPRVGLAWDIFGDGKTALRASFGVFYQRSYSVDAIASNNVGVGPMKVPPVFQAPLFLNTTFDQLSSATAFFGPQAFNAGDKRMPNPTTNNWSLSIQRDIGKGMVLDVAYVGNNAHHQQGLAENLNPIMLCCTHWTGKPARSCGTAEIRSRRGITGADYRSQMDAYTSAHTTAISTASESGSSGRS